MKIASMKNENPSIANPSPNTLPNVAVKPGHKSPSSKLSTVPVITPTATNPVEKQNGGAGGSFGVLKLTLDASSYSWEFIPIRAGGFTDSGGPVPCHTS